MLIYGLLYYNYSFFFFILLYFVQIVSAIKLRKSDLSITVPSDWLSEKYLSKSLERKGGWPKGTVSSFREKWGSEGKKQV